MKVVKLIAVLLIALASVFGYSFAVDSVARWWSFGVAFVCEAILILCIVIAPSIWFGKSAHE